MSKKQTKVFTTLNYIEHFLILASSIAGCISISAFASLIGLSIQIRSPAIGLRFCAITAWITKYKSIIKKKKKKHDQIVFLAKSKLNKVEVLISKSLINSGISHDELSLVNNVQKEFKKNKKFKNLTSSSKILVYL